MFNHPFWSKPSNVRKLVLGAILAVVAVYGLPVLQVGVKDSLTQGEKNRIDAENNSRDILVKAIGGALLFGTAWISYSTYKETKKKQVTERFKLYVDMLSSNKTYTCLGGIYSLQELAKDNEDNCHMVLEVLTAFIRDKSPAKKSESRIEDLEPHFWSLEQELQEGCKQIADRAKNIMAGLKILKQHKEFPQPDKEFLKNFVEELVSKANAVQDLSQKLIEENTELQVIGSKLKAAQEQKLQSLLNTHDSEIQAAMNAIVGIRNANPPPKMEAPFDEQPITAGFISLNSVCLDHIMVDKAHLERVLFNKSSFRGAFLGNTNNFSYSAFAFADLEGADLEGAILEGAVFTAANLQNANFTKAEGLTPDQLKEAKSCRSAKIPKYLYDQFTDEEKAKLGVICADS